MVTPKAQPSLLEKVKSAVVDSGLWKPIGGIGLVLFGALAFFIRRRRADEEFENSMLSIESNSQSINTIMDTSLSQELSATSVTASVSEVDESLSQTLSEVDEPSVHSAEADKETSFLTVYSDSDAVVQADEVDPIAEADVYIAYGRHEQAEEVLQDGIRNYPERNDIKYKLLTVYHKNENAEGFGRVAEELYSNQGSLDADMWKEISAMGKEVDASNPIYDLSVDDIAAADAAVSEMEFDGPVDEVDEPSVNELEVDVENVDKDSVHLINIDQDHSEISDLDNIEEISVELESDETDVGDDVELTIQLDDEVADIEENSLVEVMADIDITEEADSDAEFDITELQEVSDLELDADYDEQRTQFELAKVFSDLGDEDGARKILEEIIADNSADDELIEESKALLKTLS